MREGYYEATYNPNDILPILAENGEFFDFSYKMGSFMMITDYSRLNRDIIVEKDNSISLGEVKKKTELKSISELMIYVNYLLANVYRAYIFVATHSTGQKIPSEEDVLTYLTANSEMNKMLIYQVIFDILFDKYRRDAKNMNLNEYCRNHAYCEFGGKWVKMSDVPKETQRDDGHCIHETSKRNIYNMMKRQIEFEGEVTSNMRQSAMMLGVCPDLYIEFLGSRTKLGKKKPKYIWDIIFFNGSIHLITSDQYRRRFGKNPSSKEKSWRDSNYTYDEFLDDLIMYDNFIEVFMEKDGDAPEDYFLKSMDYYNLEIYKRLDFSYKLADRMMMAGYESIDKDHYMVKRFTPVIFCPTSKNDKLNYGEKHEFYRPLMFIEDLWQLKNEFSNGFYERSVIFHYQRAKIYELFKYHYEFVSEDYGDISGFLRSHFNVLDYHVKNKMWNEQGEKSTRDIKKIMKNMQTIQNTLFQATNNRKRKQ